MSRQQRPHHRRARRAIFWACVSFLAVQLGAGLLMDYRWLRIRFPSLVQTLQSLPRNSPAPELLCLGSSRFGAAFGAEEITARMRDDTGLEAFRAYNASVPAGDLLTSDYLLERLLDQGIQPDWVVIEVSPETLARRNLWMGEHARRQVTWDNLALYWPDVWRSGEISRLLSARLLPLHLHRRQIWRETQRGWLSAQANSLEGSAVASVALQDVRWQAMPDNPITLPRTERTHIGLRQIRRWLKDYRIGGGAAQALERLVHRCREHHIQVILVAAPVASAHRALYTPEIDAQFLDYMHRFAATHQCRFADYRASVPDEYFLDNHHVDPEGRKHFSRQLVEELLSPVWQAQHPAGHES
jgi:hypothetical protein